MPKLKTSKALSPQHIKGKLYIYPTNKVAISASAVYILFYNIE
jgi:hypothetical protein